MADYVVSARKYRPDNFHSVVGQSHITTTLKNAILTGQLAQAFLFCGPRGVGKTTCARIFAKTINCRHRTEEGEACNECESCRSFNNGSSFDIFELDAASNNSVDDIRDLNQQVGIPPISGGYKVYIIDEVHMLSQQAFNAFLKTLEEPPRYAKFILATTEKQKIIPTILSRCQIFDFHRIKTEDIVGQLEYVANNENVHFERAALHVMAQKADGGMRDALSTFDQLVNFTGGELSYAKVIDSLNILDYDYYFRMIDILLQSNISNALLLFDEILSKGFEGRHFLNGFSQHLRDVLVCKDSATQPLIEMSEDIKPRYIQQAAMCSPTFLLRLLNFANECSIEYRESQNKRLCVELALLKMANVMNKLNGKPIVSVATESEISSEPSHKEPAIPESVHEQKKKDTQSQSATPFESKPPVQVPIKEIEVKNSEDKSEANEKHPPKIVSPFSIQTLETHSTSTEDEKKNTLATQTATLDFLSFQEAWNLMLKDMEVELFAKDTENVSDYPLDGENLLDETFEKREVRFRFANEALVSALLSARLSQSEMPNHVDIEFKNGLQSTAFKKNYRDILQFLRGKVGVADLKFNIAIEKQSQEAMVYTVKDKYEYLVAKNPAIEELQKMLNMTIDI